MIKYLAAAATLKAFSSGHGMRRLYRSVGNVLGPRRVRRGLNRNYINRAHDFLHVVRKLDAIHDGDRILELGTGWVHWESTFIRLFYDTRATLFDVWDNRQLPAFKKYFADLAEVIDKEVEVRPEERGRVHGLLRAVSSVSSFGELYSLIGSEYLINPSGKLERLPSGSFDAIVSCSVLEHVRKDILPQYIRDFSRLLKPGGYSIQTIDIGDHLSYYDGHVCPKYYLRYSDPVWERWFENDVQYFNRVQRSEWLQLFARAGLELVAIEEELLPSGVCEHPIAEQYRNLNGRDLECTTLKIVHRKPLERTSE